MRVAPSDIGLEPTRAFGIQPGHRQAARTWTAAPDPVPAAQTAIPAPATAVTGNDRADISAAGKTLAQQPDAQQKQVLDVLNRLFGITSVASMSLNIATSHVTASASSTQQSSRQTASGLAYDYHDSYAEVEQSSLTATGTITLDDGRSFNLDLSWQQTRAYVADRSLSVRAGDAVSTAPATTPTSSVPAVDLLMAGKTAGGQADPAGRLVSDILARLFDQNGDGAVTRDELFGDTTGTAAPAATANAGSAPVTPATPTGDAAGLLLSFRVRALSLSWLATNSSQADTARSRAAQLYQGDGTGTPPASTLDQLA